MTTDTERLDALIAKLEAATEGSREMDHGIAEAVLAAGSEVRLWGQSPDEPPVKTFRYPNGSEGSALNYTTSLDAALTLVPEGWFPSVGHSAPDWLSEGEPPFFAEAHGPVTWASVPGYGDEPSFASVDARNHSLPLALVIAALKARREACR